MSLNLVLLATLLCVLLGACGSVAQPAAQSTATPAAAPSPAAPTPLPPTAPVTPTEPPAAETGPCLALEQGENGSIQPAGASQPEEGDVQYDPKTNTITLNKDVSTTLPALQRTLPEADLLRELAPGDWLLTANLRITKGAALRIQGPEVRRLKLRSDPQGFVWIKALGGELTFDTTCVVSWDHTRERYDENVADGRSFILARDGARMDVRSSELSYLGYDANESYGLAWRLEGTRGEIIDSRLGYNFYGLYSYEASELVIRGNEVHHSLRYGIDPHTRSNRLLIEDNIAHHNGKHGIILAEKCSDSIIRNNEVYANAMHGIVLYQGSNDNTVEGNRSYANGQQGININDASDNTIRNNEVHGNTMDGIGIGQNAKNNTILENRVYANTQDGITLFSEASKNTVRDNTVYDNGRYGIYVKSAGNRIGDNATYGNHVSDLQMAAKTED